jgi:hypothetical protein
MEPVLWKTNSTRLPLDELTKRCGLVWCIPRLVFDKREFLSALKELRTNAYKTCASLGVGILLRLYNGGSVGTDKSLVSVMSRFFLVEPEDDERVDAKTFLNPATVYYVREQLHSSLEQFTAAYAFEFEDVCAVLLKSGTWSGTVLPPRTIRCGANLEHTTALILSIMNNNGTVVRASNSYPVLDFATSPTTWYNTTVGDSTVKVNLSAFVTAMYLGFAEINGKDELSCTRADLNISLTVIRNTSAHECSFETKLAEKYDAMDHRQSKQVFEQVVTVHFLNTASWSPRDVLGARVDATGKLLAEYLEPVEDPQPMDE